MRATGVTRACGSTSSSRKAVKTRLGFVTRTGPAEVAHCQDRGDNCAAAFTTKPGHRFCRQANPPVSSSTGTVTPFRAYTPRPCTDDSLAVPYCNHTSSAENDVSACKAMCIFDVTACKATSDFLQNHPASHQNHPAFTRKTNRLHLKTVLFHHVGTSTILSKLPPQPLHNFFRRGGCMPMNCRRAGRVSGRDQSGGRRLPGQPARPRVAVAFSPAFRLRQPGHVAGLGRSNQRASGDCANCAQPCRRF